MSGPHHPDMRDESSSHVVGRKLDSVIIGLKLLHKSIGQSAGCRSIGISRKFSVYIGIIRQPELMACIKRTVIARLLESLEQM